jgi:hypothetical protein
LEHRRPDPPFADGVGKHRIGEEKTAPTARRHNLRHVTIAVRGQNGLAARGEADILAELVLENFQTNSACSEVATGSSYSTSPQAR